MNKIKIKICGIKNTTILDFCNKLNIDYCGLVFYNKSPRNLNIKQASNLINYQRKKKTVPVGVFVNHDLNDLLQIIKTTNLKHLQLHGNESNDFMIFQIKGKKFNSN